MQRQLEAGYTTILSGGGPGDGNLTLRQHIESGADQRPARHSVGALAARGPDAGGRRAKRFAR